jgi:hypothetical protein
MSNIIFFNGLLYLGDCFPSIDSGQALFLSSERRGNLAISTPSPFLREREGVRVS